MFGKPKALAGDIHVKNVYIEPKYDGFRVRLASDEHGYVALAIGRKSDYTHHFDGTLLPAGIIVDAEVIVNGSLQETSKVLTRHNPVPGADVQVYVFDVLEYKDEKIQNLGYVARRNLLDELTLVGNVHRVQSTWSHEDLTISELAGPYLDMGFEGIVTKSAHGRYGQEWYKYKVQRAEDFHVISWAEGQGEWAGTVGRIQLANSEGVAVGWCSTGSDANRAWFTEKIIGLGDTVVQNLGIIVEVEYQQRTRDGMLRHPRLLRVRHDLMEVI